MGSRIKRRSFIKGSAALGALAMLRWKKYGEASAKPPSAAEPLMNDRRLILLPIGSLPCWIGTKSKNPTCHPRGKTTWGVIAHHFGLRGATAATGALESANPVNELTQIQSACNTSFASMTAEATRPIGTRLVMACLRRSS